MKELFIASLFLASFAAKAHFEIGTYKGTNAQGACAVEFKNVTFNYGVHNPVNEKVEVAVNGETFFVGHEPSFDAKTNGVKVNKEVFNGFKGTTVGAKFFSLKMIHERAEGPQSFFIADHNWKTGEVTKMECENLEFIGR